MLATARWVVAFGVRAGALRVFGVRVDHVAKLAVTVAISIMKFSRYRKECQVFRF